MKILHFCWTTLETEITFWKKWPSRLRVNKWQAITRTNDDPVHWPDTTSLGLSALQIAEDIYKHLMTSWELSVVEGLIRVESPEASVWAPW